MDYSYNLLILSNFNLEEVLIDKSYINVLFDYITGNVCDYILKEDDEEAKWGASEIVILNMKEDEAETVFRIQVSPTENELQGKIIRFSFEDDNFQNILKMSERWTGYKTLIRAHTESGHRCGEKEPKNPYSDDIRILS